MALSWILFVIMHVISVLVLIISLKLLLHYTKRYKMEESRFTLLFGFIGLEHVIFAYVATMMIFIIVNVSTFVYLFNR